MDDLYVPLFRYCARCGRPLYRKESQFRGIGPKCLSSGKADKVLKLIDQIRQPELFEVHE